MQMSAFYTAAFDQMKLLPDVIREEELELPVLPRAMPEQREQEGSHFLYPRHTFPQVTFQLGKLLLVLQTLLQSAPQTNSSRHILCER